MSSDSRPRPHRCGDQLREQDASRSRPCSAGDDIVSGRPGDGGEPRGGFGTTSGWATDWWRRWGGGAKEFADEHWSVSSRRRRADVESLRCTRPRDDILEESVTVGADGCHGGGDHSRIDGGGWGNARQSGGKALRKGQAGFTLGILVALAAVSLVDGWIAYADREAVPTIPGTTLRSDLMLPDDLTNMGSCTIAITSLEKVFVVCFSSDATPGQCSPQCAAAWNSALRDAQCLTPAGTCDASQKSCVSLENHFNRKWPSGMSSSGQFEELEYMSLRQKCLIDSGCPAETCDLSISGIASLQPGLNDLGGTCDFKVESAFGYRTYPFLTWSSLQRYESEQRGGAGGLSISSDSDYETWACVDAPGCGNPAETMWGDDMACFKYSRMRGEFVWWDWNSNLNIHRPLYELDAAFCNPAGESTLLDARSPGEAGISLLGWSYSMHKTDANGRILDPFASGVIANLGDYGCSPVKVREQYRIWLRVYPDVSDPVASQYYAWSGWFLTLKPPKMQMSLAMYPKIQECDSLGITLQWCELEFVDLDLYLFYPTVPGDDYIFDQSRAVYWANQIEGMSKYEGPYKQAGGWEEGGATITLERDDWGGSREFRSYGPESIYIRGRLMPGRYAVAATIWTSENAPANFKGGCATVNLYSGVSTSGSVLARSVLEKGHKSRWWHVFNILVEEGASGRSYSVETVDKMVTGPSVGELGDFEPEPAFFNPPRSDLDAFADNLWVGDGLPGIDDPTTYIRGSSQYLFLSSADEPGTCFQYAYIGLTLYSASSSQLVGSGSFTVNGQETVWPYPQYGSISFSGPGERSGGFQLLAGSYEWVISSPGYAPYTLKFDVTIGMTWKDFSIFMIPSDGYSRAVLNWENDPSDLDIYVIPLGVKAPAPTSTAVHWIAASLSGNTYDPPPTFREAEPPYLWWGLAEAGTECTCDDDDGDPATPCIPQCLLNGMLSQLSFPGPQDIKISIDRDDYIHGETDEFGRVRNAPEVASLRNLLPGVYAVYANVYTSGDGTDPLPVFTSEVKFDVWLGDGTPFGEVIQVASVILPAFSGGKWYYAGFFNVEQYRVDCDGPLQRRQLTGLEMCITWQTTGQLVEDPRGLDQYPVRLVLADSSSTTGVDFSTATYQVSKGGSCDCFGHIECVCQDTEFVSRGQIGPNNGGGTAGARWTGETPIRLYEGEFNVVVNMDGYYGRFIKLKVKKSLFNEDGELLAYATMVPVVQEGELRITLRWGASPLDLDLWIVRKEQPGVDTAVFWGQTNSDYSLHPDMDDIMLEKDQVSSWGPETILIGSGANALQYRVAVNVYSTTEDGSQCDPTTDGACRFASGETVEFYDYRGLLANDYHIRKVSSWWVVGTVTKKSDGKYSVDIVRNLQIASCADVFDGAEGCPI